MAKLLVFGTKSHPENPELLAFVRKSFGIRPKNTEVYIRAFKHKSVAKVNEQGFKESNERLEFLGDSVIGTIVSEYLFEKFPHKPEGFLTQMKSKIVSRKSLNHLGEKTGIEPLIQYQKNNAIFKSLLGNVFEALFGAIYLDKGYKVTKKVLIERVLIPYIDLEALEKTDIDFKSKLLIHSQKNKLNLEFRQLKEEKVKGKLQFTMGIFINDELQESAIGQSKRVAEQEAARMVLEKLKKD